MSLARTTIVAAAVALIAAAAAVAGVPVNSSPPAVTGDPIPGSTLICDPGHWEDVIDGAEPVVAWVVDGVKTTDFGSPDAMPLSVTEEMLGRRVACQARAANIEGWASPVQSAEVTIVRCSAATLEALADELEIAKEERAEAKAALAAAKKAYAKLAAAQAKAKKAYFARESDPMKRKTFLKKQAAARAKAKAAVKRAQNDIAAAQGALAQTQSRLAACN